MKGFVINLIRGYFFCFFALNASAFNDYGGLVLIPDVNFENYLETHDANGDIVAVGDPTSLGDGVLGNGQVDNNNFFLVSSLDLQNLGIEDLEGIQQFSNLTDLDVRDNPIELLDISNMSNLINVNAQNCTLKAVKLKFFSVPSLTTIDLSNNPDLNCIWVDNITDAQNNAPGWNPGTGNYIDSTFLSITDANDVFVNNDEFDVQAEMDSWISNNGDAEGFSDCGDLTYSYNYTTSYIDTDLVYNFEFIATDIWGDQVSTNATFTINNGGDQFGDATFYGTGNFICDDTYDLNLILKEHDDLFGTTWDLTRAENTLISVEEVERPPGFPPSDISGTIVDFPDSGAGSYTYRYNIVSEKAVSVYNPVSGIFETENRQDDIDVTIFERKLVAYDAGPDQTIYITPNTTLTRDQLTGSLIITPDLPPQDPGFEQNNYWSGFDTSGNSLTITENNGGGYYTWDAQGTFSECFSSPEEELDAVVADLTVVSGYEFGLVHVTDYDFKIVIIPSFNSTVNVDVTTMQFTLMLPAGASNIQSFFGIMGGGNWSANEFTAATLTSQGLGDGTRDAIRFFGNVNEPFLTHHQGDVIEVMGFTINNPPSSGLISILANNDPIANGAGAFYKGEFNCDIDNTFENDYYFNPKPNLDSFDLSTLSESNLESTNEITVYPNPTSDKLFISDSRDSIKKLEFYSMQGQLLLELKDNPNEVDLRNFKSSLYFLKIYSDSATEVIKLIKE